MTRYSGMGSRRAGACSQGPAKMPRPRPCFTVVTEATRWNARNAIHVALWEISNAPIIPSHAKHELDFPGVIKRGATGIKVRRVQEWLTFHHCPTGIDGGFGSATEVAVRAFQSKKGLSVTGKVNQDTWGSLVAPLLQALSVNISQGDPLDVAVLALATLKQSGRGVDQLYFQDRANHKQVKMYTLEPSELFVLSRLAFPSLRRPTLRANRSPRRSSEAILNGEGR